VCGYIVGGIDENKPGEIAHRVHQISVTAVIGDVTGCPKVNMQDVKWAAKWPGKD
jgi:hypothetical protein